MCWYLIGVRGTSEEYSTYMLTARYAPGSIVIEENESFSSLILEDEKQYFAFFLEDRKGVQSITFRISTTNAAYLVSRTCEFVTYECSLETGTNEMPVTLSGSEIEEGAYYVTVIGIEPTLFSLSVEVRRLDATHLM